MTIAPAGAPLIINKPNTVASGTLAVPAPWNVQSALLGLLRSFARGLFCAFPDRYQPCWPLKHIGSPWRKLATRSRRGDNPVLSAGVNHFGPGH